MKSCRSRAQCVLGSDIVRPISFMTTAKRILLIDDDPTFTRMVRVLLEGSGNYSVEEENNSRNAFAKARWFRPDLIFLDVMMPEVDGGDIAQQIESDALLRGTPIVFFTGLVSEGEAVSDRIGGYKFIAKPFRRDQLLGCVEEILKTDRFSSNESTSDSVSSVAARLIRPFKRQA